MVRIIIPAGETMPPDEPGTSGYPGPVEIVCQSWNFVGFPELGYVEHGEYIVWNSTPEKTLPFLREELTITMPIAAVIGFALALSWFRKLL